MTRVIGFVNQKGEAGKSTTAANLAFSLANQGKSVLAIDFDSNAILSNYYNFGKLEDEQYGSIYELLVHQLHPENTEEDTEIPNNSLFNEVL